MSKMPCLGAYSPGGTRTTNSLITSQDRESLHHGTLTKERPKKGGNLLRKRRGKGEEEKDGEADEDGEHNTGWPEKKPGTVDTVDFSGLCSEQQLSFFTLLDRASFPHIITPRSSNLVENFLFYE